MGFDPNTNRKPEFRSILTERDRAYLRNCHTCGVAKLCGGWSVWNDARWCDGPGSVCMTGCRAVCSRSPEKIDLFARMLASDEFMVGGDGLARPVHLGLVGRHPWKRWEAEWPDIGFQVNAGVGGEYHPLITFSFKKLYRPETKFWAREKDLRKRLQLHPDTRLALTTTCKDAVVDPFEADVRGFAKRIAEYGFDFFLGPNFSVYSNFPRLDNLFRIKSKWRALDALQEEGVRVVPDICFVTKTDFDEQLAWMRENRCTVMMVNFQAQHVTTDKDDWYAQVRAVRVLRDRLGWPVRMLAYGAQGGSRPESVISEYGPDVTFLDASAYPLAERSKDTDKQWLRSTGMPMLDIFRRNVEALRTKVARAKGLPPFPALGETRRMEIHDGV